MGKKLINIFKKIILGEQKSWVLFENGTCVILMRPENDLAQQAKNMLSEFGPVHAGTPSGDFKVIELDDEDGWVVGCHHPDILTYVFPNETEQPYEEVEIGLLGRSKREIDTNELNIIHIENKKSK